MKKLSFLQCVELHTTPNSQKSPTRNFSTPSLCLGCEDIGYEPEPKDERKCLSFLKLFLLFLPLQPIAAPFPDFWEEYLLERLQDGSLYLNGCIIIPILLLLSFIDSP